MCVRTRACVRESTAHGSANSSFRLCVGADGGRDQAAQKAEGVRSRVREAGTVLMSADAENHNGEDVLMLMLADAFGSAHEGKRHCQASPLASASHRRACGACDGRPRLQYVLPWLLRLAAPCRPPSPPLRALVQL
eukprot:2760214-Pleurochrysis_carterae.AAC.2